MKVEHIESRSALTVAITAEGLIVLVASRAECLVACSGKHYHSYVAAFAADVEGIEHLGVGERTEGIIHFRAVDCNLGYAFILLKQYVAIALYGSPFSV